MGDRTGHYDKLYAKAHSLMGAYDNLRQLKELFEGAAEVEKYMAEAENKKEQINRTIKSLGEHKEELSHRCQDEVDQIKSQKTAAESDLVAMAKKYTDRYEADYGKRVKEAERKVEDAEKKLKRLEGIIESKTSIEKRLDEHISLRNSQVDALNKQFQNIKESLTVGG